MIHSRPKSTSLVAVGVFLLIVLATDGWLLAGLIRNPSSYFVWKLVLVPTLFVIGITVAVKSYFSASHLSLGKDKLTYHYPFSSPKTHPVSEISSWHEDVIKRKNSTYRRVSILLVDGKKLTLSNHENSNYDKVVGYLKKKVKHRK